MTFDLCTNVDLRSKTNVIMRPEMILYEVTLVGHSLLNVSLHVSFPQIHFSYLPIYLNISHRLRRGVLLFDLQEKYVVKASALRSEASGLNEAQERHGSNASSPFLRLPARPSP